MSRKYLKQNSRVNFQGFFVEPLPEHFPDDQLLLDLTTFRATPTYRTYKGIVYDAQQRYVGWPVLSKRQTGSYTQFLDYFASKITLPTINGYIAAEMQYFHTPRIVNDYLQVDNLCCKIDVPFLEMEFSGFLPDKFTNHPTVYDFIRPFKFKIEFQDFTGTMFRTRVGDGYVSQVFGLNCEVENPGSLGTDVKISESFHYPAGSNSGTVGYGTPFNSLGTPFGFDCPDTKLFWGFFKYVPKVTQVIKDNVLVNKTDFSEGRLYFISNIGGVYVPELERNVRLQYKQDYQYDAQYHYLQLDTINSEIVDVDHTPSIKYRVASTFLSGDPPEIDGNILYNEQVYEHNHEQANIVGFLNIAMDVKNFKVTAVDTGFSHSLPRNPDDYSFSGSNIDWQAGLYNAQIAALIGGIEHGGIYNTETNPVFYGIVPDGSFLNVVLDLKTILTGYVAWYPNDIQSFEPLGRENGSNVFDGLYEFVKFLPSNGQVTDNGQVTNLFDVVISDALGFKFHDQTHGFYYPPFQPMWRRTESDIHGQHWSTDSHLFAISAWAPVGSKGVLYESTGSQGIDILKDLITLSEVNLLDVELPSKLSLDIISQTFDTEIAAAIKAALGIYYIPQEEATYQTDINTLFAHPGTHAPYPPGTDPGPQANFMPNCLVVKDNKIAYYYHEPDGQRVMFRMGGMRHPRLHLNMEPHRRWKEMLDIGKEELTNPTFKTMENSIVRYTLDQIDYRDLPNQPFNDSHNPGTFDGQPYNDFTSVEQINAFYQKTIDIVPTAENWKMVQWTWCYTRICEQARDRYVSIVEDFKTGSKVRKHLERRIVQLNKYLDERKGNSHLCVFDRYVIAIRPKDSVYWTPYHEEVDFPYGRLAGVRINTIGIKHEDFYNANKLD